MSGRFRKRPAVILFGLAIFFSISILFQFGTMLSASESKQFLNSSGDRIPTHQFEKKVTSSGGYAHLFSKARSKGRVRIIVKVAVPYQPESLISEQEGPKQRAAIADKQGRVFDHIRNSGKNVFNQHAFTFTPLLSMTVDAETLATLLDSADVDSIQEDIPVPATLNLSVPRIGASTMHSSGMTGAGVAVAILDTGVDKNHPFISGGVISEACYSSNSSYYGSSSVCPGGVTDSIASGSAMPYGGSCPAGECDHGTHVAGIAAGRSGIGGSPGPGVAPGAGIIAIQVFSRFDSEDYCGVGWSPCALAWTSDIIKGLERVYALRSTYTISSVNLSLGGGAYSSNCDSESEKSIIDSLRAAGIATVIASGNGGYCGYISSPGCISSAISIGATTDSDTVASYSNSASFLSLLAPGSSINSSVPGSTYQSWNGTSMATPHVTGAWALMKQSNPLATVNQILSAFSSTGLTVSDSKCSSVSKKRINVNEADNLLSPDIPPTVTTGSATNVTTTSATLNGTVNPNGLSTTYYFQWGTTGSYGNTTSTLSAGSGSSNVAVSVNISSLSTSTTYHYRLVATNSAGNTYGSDMALTTLGPPAASTPITPWGTMALTSPTYYWYAQSTATQYRLYIDDSTGNKVDQWYTAAEVGCASGTGICSYKPSITLAQGTGSWKIQTRNSYGDGPWSSSLNLNIVTSVPKVDFNNDGKTDILWRNKENGDVVVWYMNGATLMSGAGIYQGVSLAWDIVGTGDFNNDGKSDILWRNKNSGDVVVWYMNGATLINGAGIYQGVSLAWDIVGTGDFNNDGKTDILWRNKENGDVVVWYMNGTTLMSGAGIYQGVSLAWDIVGTGDFNNDGKTDILWRNKENGDVVVWYMNGTTLMSGAGIYQGVSLAWDIVGTGDFNNDGKTDILWRNKENGDVVVWYMNGMTLMSGAGIYQGVSLVWEIAAP